MVAGMLMFLGYGMLKLQSVKAKRVQRVTQANPELLAAIKNAKATLPKFISELKANKPGTRFAVKGTFKTESGNEYLWVKDPVLTGSVFTGTLDQVPMALPNVAKGDSIRVNQVDVVDWLIHDSSGDQGEFTEKVLGK